MEVSDKGVEWGDGTGMAGTEGVTLLGVSEIFYALT